MSFQPETKVSGLQIKITNESSQNDAILNKYNYNCKTPKSTIDAMANNENN